MVVVPLCMTQQDPSRPTRKSRNSKRRIRGSRAASMPSIYKKKGLVGGEGVGRGGDKVKGKVG